MPKSLLVHLRSQIRGPAGGEAIAAAASARRLIARSHVIRSRALPGKIARQYGVKRRSDGRSVAKTLVSVVTRDEDAESGTTRKFIVARTKPRRDSSRYASGVEISPR